MAQNNEDWAFSIEEQVFTIVKNKGLKQLKSKYPNIFFTSTDLPADATIKYPTVYIHGLNASETGMDLKNNHINAVFQSFQVDVTTNKSQDEANKVMAVIATIFKSMYFTVSAMPTFENGNTTYRSTARFRRIIASGDKY